jgi:hypothetical protein
LKKRKSLAPALKGPGWKRNLQEKLHLRIRVRREVVGV